ncbi:MAG: PilZ domain-containing protein [Sedimentisphaerales bacterium]|nr:PilZ domain-containing protein [Sedimentisphaerales bacterium]
METMVEQRKSLRTEVAWPVSVWLPEANRFINGRSANISKTGVLLRLPATTPLNAGNIVELNFPRTMTLAKKKGGFARIKSGKVVRVDRGGLLDDASISVGVAFEEIEY